MQGTRKKTPKGIVIITILTIISGLILLTMSIFSFIILHPLGPAKLLGPFFLFIIGIASIIVSIGLYSAKGWAWTLLLVLSGFGAAGYLLNIVNGQFISIIGLVIDLIIIYYLYRPNVRKYFTKK
jgi:hypothetical protein